MCRLVLPLKIGWVNTPINLFLISIEIDPVHYCRIFGALAAEYFYLYHFPVVIG